MTPYQKANANPVLMERTRGDEVESFHRGAVCAVNALGQMIFSMGDPQQMCYPRSTLKLFQVVPLLEAGGQEAFGLTLEEIAIMCGSHNGEKEHVRVVRQIFEKIGLKEELLSCGAQPPALAEDKNYLIKHDLPPIPVFNNCSGKHAGFLALCVLGGYDIHTYLDPEHPVQVLVKNTVADFCGLPPDQLEPALDGCSAPIYAMPLFNQALAYMRLTGHEEFSEERRRACQTLMQAMAEYPFMVAGSKRYCSELLASTRGQVIGKTGADGVYMLVIPHAGVSLGVKIDDGSMGPQYAITQALLEYSGLVDKQLLAPLHHYINEPLLNWNKLEVGRVRVPPHIMDQLNNWALIAPQEASEPEGLAV